MVEFYNGKRLKEELKGVSYLKETSIYKAPPQEQIKNLDNLPFPDRSKIPINKYYDWFHFGMKKPYVNMMAARGCVFNCSFCTSWNIWERKYRMRSVDNVIAEIDFLREKYGIRYIAFHDDIWGLNNSWIIEFCKKLIARKYHNLHWMCILHPNSIRGNTKEILIYMKKAGCDAISFGLQSADPKMHHNVTSFPLPC